ncbi:MAG TPA: hypothetical protein VGI33_05955 [Paenibacillus sp.]
METVGITENKMRKQIYCEPPVYRSGIYGGSRGWGLAAPTYSILYTRYEVNEQKQNHLK